MVTPILNESRMNIKCNRCHRLLLNREISVSYNKGFMMECTTWSGAESLNLQFMVPKVCDLV